MNKCFGCGNEYKACREYIEPAVAILTEEMKQYDKYIITETNPKPNKNINMEDFSDFWYSREMQKSMKHDKQSYASKIESFVKLFDKDDSSIMIISETCDQWLNI